MQQRDLLIGEGPRRLARDDDRADAPRLHQHRRIEHGHAARLLNLDLELFRQVRLVGEIGKMHRAALRDGEAGGAARERQDVGAPVAIAPAAPRHAFRHVAIDEIDGGGLQPEQALAGFQDRLEHGRGVGDGAADDFQHIGRGRLERERLFEVSRPRLHLLEQPRILDGDDGLIGECLDEFDLSRRVGARFRPREHDDPDQIVAALHRHAERSVGLHASAHTDKNFGILAHVRDVLHFAREGNARDGRTAAWPLRMGLHVGDEIGATLPRARKRGPAWRRFRIARYRRSSIRSARQPSR